MDQSLVPKPRPALPEGLGVHVSDATGKTFRVTRNQSQPAPDSRPQAEHETTVRAWLQQMSDGLAERADILAAILPRVAPELPVVALAAQRLLATLEETVGWQLYLDHPLPGKRTRCDLIVQRPSGEHPRATYFEWRALWPSGRRERIAALTADRRKLADLPAGTAYVVAFAYAVELAPAGCNTRVRGDAQSLEQTVAHAITELGAPFFCSTPFRIAGLGAVADAQIVAWRVCAQRPPSPTESVPESRG